MPGDLTGATRSATVAVMQRPRDRPCDLLVRGAVLVATVDDDRRELDGRLGRDHRRARAGGRRVGAIRRPTRRACSTPTAAS